MNAHTVTHTHALMRHVKDNAAQRLSSMRRSSERLDEVVGYARTVLLVAFYCIEMGLYPYLRTRITQSTQHTRVICRRINDKRRRFLLGFPLSHVH